MPLRAGRRSGWVAAIVDAVFYPPMGPAAIRPPTPASAANVRRAIFVGGRMRRERGGQDGHRLGWSEHNL